LLLINSTEILLLLFNIIRRSRQHTLTFTTIHKQPFPLPHYCGISIPPNVALVAQTHARCWGVIHQHDNATPHSARKTKLLQLFHTAVPQHPSYCLGHWSSTWEGADATITKW